MSTTAVTANEIAARLPVMLLHADALLGDTDQSPETRKLHAELVGAILETMRDVGRLQLEAER